MNTGNIPKPISGLRENWAQFTLLVIVNAFTGGIIGMERSIMPLIGKEEFGLESTFTLLSFIAVFGASKAVSNYFSGRAADRIGRRKVLITGWLFALPVPFLLIYAPNWNVILAANVLIGINQGLTWSSAVVMKIDLAGPKNRGLAAGINEFAGYLSVGVFAWLTAEIAETYGLRPYPFYTGIILSFMGLIISWLFIRDTRSHVQAESTQSTIPKLKHIFKDTTWRHPQLGSITQAGLVNNLNDGMIWGILPLLPVLQAGGTAQIGLLAAVYPAVWGLGQLISGPLADRLPKKKMLVWGMLVQGIAIIAFISAVETWHFITLAVIIGLGTAAVYPTFLAAAADFTHPEQRGESLGVFRFWRDSGYVFGAILSGIAADLFGPETAVAGIGVLTVISAIAVKIRM